MYRRSSRILGRILFSMAHLVACVSYSNAEETIKNAHVPPNKLRIARHGFYDPNSGNEKHLTNKEKMVITVGRIDMATIHRKGLLAAARLSRFFPDIPFVFMGTSEPQALRALKMESGENANFTGYVEETGFAALLKRAKVYLQISMHEAFGCSVAEAMLYNCIPIVANRYSLPEVVGDAGICVNPDNLDEVTDVITKVLNDTYELLESPRDRVLREFPMSKRTNILVKLIEDLCKA